MLLYNLARPREDGPGRHGDTACARAHGRPIRRSKTRPRPAPTAHRHVRCLRRAGRARMPVPARSPPPMAQSPAVYVRAPGDPGLHCERCGPGFRMIRHCPIGIWPRAVWRDGAGAGRGPDGRPRKDTSHMRAHVRAQKRIELVFLIGSTT